MWMISVYPFDLGWAVRVSQIANDLVFRSGADAERAARLLGRRLAEAGEAVQIEVLARDDSVAGRWRVGATTPLKVVAHSSWSEPRSFEGAPRARPSPERSRLTASGVRRQS